jgi:hypothetical protein
MKLSGVDYPFGATPNTSSKITKALIYSSAKTFNQTMQYTLYQQTFAIIFNENLNFLQQ